MNLKNKQDSCIGRISVFENENKVKIFFKSFMISNENKKNKIIKKLIKRKSFKHDNLINMIDFKVITHSNLCNNSYEILLYYKYYSNNISKLLYKNDESKNKKIILIMYTLIELLSCLQLNGLSHGGLDPNLIKIDENENILLMDNLLIEDEININKLYVSPERFRKILGIDNIIETYNLFKCDSFSLGLILLELGINESIQSIYNFELGMINEKKLNFFINKLKKIYYNLPTYYNCIIKLLDINILNRYDFLELKHALPNRIDLQIYFKINEENNNFNSKLYKSTYNNKIINNDFKNKNLIKSSIFFKKNDNKIFTYNNNIEENIKFDNILEHKFNTKNNNLFINNNKKHFKDNFKKNKENNNLIK